jgi:hypothetical protein
MGEKANTPKYQKQTAEKFAKDSRKKSKVGGGEGHGGAR